MYISMFCLSRSHFWSKMTEFNFENDLKFLVKNDSWSTIKLIFGRKWPNVALKMNLTYFNKILILKILELVFSTNDRIFRQKWQFYFWSKMTEFNFEIDLKRKFSFQEFWNFTFLSWECDPNLSLCHRLCDQPSQGK